MSQAIRCDRSSSTMPAGEGRRAADRRDRPRILILGGSQGAHVVNLAVVAAAPELARRVRGLEIVHQTGERDLAAVRDGYAGAGVAARAAAFLDPVAGEMKAADLVIARAGATTLAELAAAGRPAVLVPFAAATDDHQRKNADALVCGRRGGDDRRSRPERSDTRRGGEQAAGRPGAARRDEPVDARPGEARRGRAHRGSRDGAGAVMWFGRTRRVHFVGIGGIGMSGIAELVANLGYRVSGSDARRSDLTDRLASLGVTVSVGHDARHVERRRRRGGVISNRAGQPGGRRSTGAPHPRDPAGGDARRADAAARRHRDRRGARQDDDDVDGRLHAGARWASIPRR